jgi:hypothetical protein
MKAFLQADYLNPLRMRKPFPTFGTSSAQLDPVCFRVDMPLFHILRQITDRRAVIVSPLLHLVNQLVVAFEEQGGVYESVFDKSPDIFTLIEAACQHMQFQVLS